MRDINATAKKSNINNVYIYSIGKIILAEIFIEYIDPSI